MDDTLFDLFHIEMVAQIIRASKKKDDIDSCVTKLEAMGYRVGQSLIERVLKESPRFKDELDVMKFICKDFWSSIFKKQVDNLRTNHQGVYVLQDNKFKVLTEMSAGKQYLEMAPRYLAFSCGLLRGALSNLGINCVVTSEVILMPSYYDATELTENDDITTCNMTLDETQ